MKTTSVNLMHTLIIRNWIGDYSRTGILEKLDIVHRRTFRQRERQNILNKVHAYYSSWYRIGSNKLLASVHVLMYVQQAQF